MSLNTQGLPDGNAITYRLTTVEDELRGLKVQLDRYETTRENDLKLQGIRDTLRRIENDIADIKQQLTSQEKASQERDAAVQQEQSQFKIRVLYGVLSVLGGIAATVVAALIINFLMHVP